MGESFAEQRRAFLKRVDRLEPRLQRVLMLVAQGKRNPEIAIEQRLAKHTVENYVSELTQELGCRGRADLMVKLDRYFRSDEVAADE